MSINISNEDVSILNSIEYGIITKIDELFSRNNSYRNCCINDFLTCGLKPEVASIFIGIWSIYNFLNSRGQILDEEPCKYKPQTSKEIELVINGLINLIRYSTIEEDIDEHYNACLELAGILGNEAEKRIVEQIKINPNRSLVEALGVLVGHQALGVLSEESIHLLEDIADDNDKELSKVARSVLVEDVNRMMKTQYNYPLQV